jgi:glycine cleavage system H protein
VTPNDLKFAKTHEWVRVAQDAPGKKIATIGISDFALKALTDLVFIELPAVGRKVQAGQPFGEVESVKAVSDLYSPVDGEVVEINAAVSENIEHLADDPYGAGWLVKIAVSDDRGLDQLLDEATYRKQCEEESAE